MRSTRGGGEVVRGGVSAAIGLAGVGNRGGDCGATWKKEKGASEGDGGGQGGPEWARWQGWGSRPWQPNASLIQITLIRLNGVQEV